MTDNNLKITYKGEDIVDADISTATTKTLKTSGKYCEGDITITAQGGSGGNAYQTTITENGTNYVPHLKECEWIQSDGIYGIDTGINSGGKACYIKKCIFKFLELPEDDGIDKAEAIFGDLIRASPFIDRCFALYLVGNELKIADGTNLTGVSLVLTDDTEKNRWYDVETINRTTVLLDGEVVGTLPINGRYENYNFAIFAGANFNTKTTNTRYAKAVIKKLLVYNSNDTPLIDFVPMKSVDDGSAWYYNRVSGEYKKLQECFVAGDFVDGGLEINEYTSFASPLTVNTNQIEKRLETIETNYPVFINSTTTINGTSSNPKNYYWSYKLSYCDFGYNTVIFKDIKSITGSYSQYALSNIMYKTTAGSVIFKELTDVTAPYAFNGFSTNGSVRNFEFKKLKNVSGTAFDGAFLNGSVWFYNFDETSTVSLNKMFEGRSNTGNVHFKPSNIKIDAIREAMNISYSSSGTVTTYFDIGAELTFVSSPSDCVEYLYSYPVENHIGYVDADIASNYYIYSQSLNKVYKGSEQALELKDKKTVTNDLSQIQTNKITLSANIGNLPTTFTIDSIDFNASNEGNNYTINENIGTGESITYHIDGGSDYNNVDGTITTTGSDITIPITISPAVYETFVRPNLTSNGTMGGDSFAVSGEQYSTTYACWRAVDGNTTTTNYWRPATGSAGSVNDYYFYNPNPLKLTSLTFRWPSATYRASQVVVAGSNDGETYTTIGTYALSSATSVTAQIDSNTPYKYFKLSLTQYGTQLRLTELTMDALEKQ